MVVVLYIPVESVKASGDAMTDVTATTPRPKRGSAGEAHAPVLVSGVKLGYRAATDAHANDRGITVSVH
jgi:hypothetical protein